LNYHQNQSKTDNSNKNPGKVFPDFTHHKKCFSY